MKFFRNLAITLTLLLNVTAIAHAEMEGHDADVDNDGLLSLSETLRVVQFFNLKGVHVDENSEDGYGAGPGPMDGYVPHSSDYDPADGVIELKELLRALQIFNSENGYITGCGGEDGFQVVAKGTPLDVVGFYDGSGPYPGQPGYTGVHPIRSGRSVDVEGNVVAVASMAYNEVLILDATTLSTTNSLPATQIIGTPNFPGGDWGLHPSFVDIQGSQVTVVYRDTNNSPITGAIAVFDINDGDLVSHLVDVRFKGASDAAAVGSNIFVANNGNLTKVVRGPGGTLSIQDTVTDTVLLNGPAPQLDVAGGTVYVTARNARSVIAYDVSDLSQIASYQDTVSNINDTITMWAPTDIVVDNGFVYVRAMTLIEGTSPSPTIHGSDLLVLDAATLSVIPPPINLPAWMTISGAVVPGLGGYVLVSDDTLYMSSPDGIFSLDVSSAPTLSAPTLVDPFSATWSGVPPYFDIAGNGDIYVVGGDRLEIWRDL